MARYILLTDFPSGTSTLKAGTVLDDAVGDPIASLKADGAPMVLATSALETLATAMVQSAVGGDNGHVGPGVAQQVARVVEVDFQKEAADAAAGTATAERVIYRASRPCVVQSVHLTAGAALTADNANNATVLVRRRDAAGASPATVVSYTTNVASGGLTANVPKALTTTVLALAVGETLTFEITKGGTGVVVPPGTLSVVATLD